MVNESIIPVTHQNKIVGTKTISIHINTSRLQVLLWQRPGNNVQYSQRFTLLVSGSENLGYLITCVDLQISGYPRLEEALPTTPRRLLPTTYRSVALLENPRYMFYSILFTMKNCHDKIRFFFFLRVIFVAYLYQ